MLKKGIYDQIINKNLHNELNKIENINALKIFKTIVNDDEDFSNLLFSYISENIRIVLNNVKGKNNKLGFANKIMEIIKCYTNENGKIITDNPPEKLDGVIKKEKVSIVKPLTSISRSSLFTGSKIEPKLYQELKREIHSADEILMLVSFIKWSGIRFILDELKDFTDHGGNLKIITTTYIGVTDPKAMEKLGELKNTEIKISYDTQRTRLHAKTYVFLRNTGFSTAYIGSSNLSDAAMSSGLEWNLKITEKDQPEAMDKIRITFDSYWNSKEFTEYEYKEFQNAIKNEKIQNNNKATYNFELQPYLFQQEILDELYADRVLRGHYRNLIVSSTGTGKTMIAAFDYRRYAQGNRFPKLLYVAHREEILKQSLEAFRAVLKNPNFGDLYVGKYKPVSYEYLFISIQSFNSIDLTSFTSSDYYDYIVIDEFHHAASKSYQKLINHYNPKIMIGLTATPERMDGRDILKYFDDHITSEIRLAEAIDRKLLSPFHYFVVTDNVNLSNVKWHDGKYDVKELTKIYTNGNISNARLDLIYNSVMYYLDDIEFIKGIGFCVSIGHAEFMSNYFNKMGIPSIAISSNSTSTERENARNNLINGNIKFIFVVDIYNEGVDIPEINTVLFLRPTESLTVYLQQFGRGLRLSPGKEYLTVLDFVGESNSKYDFSSKFLSLITDRNKNIKSEINNDFNDLPAGCYLEMEKKAKEYILSNIGKAIKYRSGIVAKIQELYNISKAQFDIQDFLDYYNIEPDIVYKFNNFSRLLNYAGIINDFNEPNEGLITTGLKKLCYIDSKSWVEFILKILKDNNILNYNNLSENEISMLNMFQITIWKRTPEKIGYTNSIECILGLNKSPILKNEIISLLEYRLSRINFIEASPGNHENLPLKVHCSYTRDQALVALNYMSPENIREGVFYVKDMNVDVLFVTINKDQKDYSMTTMYNDYIINDELFHWQSQSTTSDKSPTAIRYFNADNINNSVFLFVREYKENKLIAAPYKFLGPVTYVKHEGTNPVSITWKLKTPINAATFKDLSNVIRV